MGSHPPRPIISRSKEVLGLRGLPRSDQLVRRKKPLGKAPAPIDTTRSKEVYGQVCLAPVGRVDRSKEAFALSPAVVLNLKWCIPEPFTRLILTLFDLEVVMGRETSPIGVKSQSKEFRERDLPNWSQSRSKEFAVERPPGLERTANQKSSGRETSRIGVRADQKSSRWRDLPDWSESRSKEFKGKTPSLIRVRVIKRVQRLSIRLETLNRRS
jgi:hypothetical protein